LAGILPASSPLPPSIRGRLDAAAGTRPVGRVSFAELEKESPERMEWNGCHLLETAQKYRAIRFR
jgi:hypothetical protein